MNRKEGSAFRTVAKSHVFLQCIAIEDINPQAPVHFLVIPKKEIRTMKDATDEDEQVGKLLYVILKCKFLPVIKHGLKSKLNFVFVL